MKKGIISMKINKQGLSDNATLDKDDAISFLIVCYFGTEEDPILAALDKAYIDMQTHTVSGNQKTLFKKRKEITEFLYNKISHISDEVDYDTWHKSVSDQVKKKYPKLSYGQIQKWINMTVKYLYTLKQLGVNGISDYFSNDHISDFHPALDSYVLSAINEEGPWSKIKEYDEYDAIRKKLSFEQEYLNWPQYARNASLKKDGTEKKAEKNTYKRYLQDNGGYTLK